jgi:hypothetical protein
MEATKDNDEQQLDQISAVLVKLAVWVPVRRQGGVFLSPEIISIIFAPYFAGGNSCILGLKPLPGAL